MKVHHAMTKKPIYLRSRDKLHNAVKVFSKQDISGCPVVTGKKVVGVITRTDIITAIDPHAKIIKDIDLLALVNASIHDPRFENMRSSIRKTMSMSVSAFMNKDVITVGYDEDIYNAARIMNEKDISMLPVVRNEKLIGVLTRTDVIRVLEKLS